MALLENLSFQAVETYLKEKDSILVPVGSVEQHSPFGLIGTDFITAQGIAQRVAEEMEILVAPTLCYGSSPHHMAFAGTVSIGTATLIHLVCDITRSLNTHGFRRVVFVNGHGGNTHPVKTAFQELKTEMLEGCVALISWFELEPVRKLTDELFAGKEGHHATPGEVSITRYLRPEMFHDIPSDEESVPDPDYYWPLHREEMKRVFPDGRMESAPWLATGESGRLILETACRAVREQLEKIMSLELMS